MLSGLHAQLLFMNNDSMAGKPPIILTILTKAYSRGVQLYVNL